MFEYQNTEKLKQPKKTYIKNEESTKISDRKNGKKFPKDKPAHPVKIEIFRKNIGKKYQKMITKIHTETQEKKLMKIILRKL